MIPGPSDFDVANIQRILSGEGDWWSAELLRLIAKSDRAHREALRLAAPLHVAAYEAFARDGSAPRP